MGRNPDPTFAEVQGVQSIIAKLLQKVAKDFVQAVFQVSWYHITTKHFVPNYHLTTDDKSHNSVAHFSGLAWLLQPFVNHRDNKQE